MLGIVCDCHNTLVNSNEAWINAFTDYAGEDKRNNITLDLYKRRMKRCNIAYKYGVDLDCVTERANKYTAVNQPLKKLLCTMKAMGMPLFVVSNAPYAKVMNDLKNVKISNLFDKIYAKENGGKKNSAIFDEIIEEYELDMLLFIGNEEFDDNIVHPKVVSTALTSFLLKRFLIVRDYKFDNIEHIDG